jgi:squalene-hopene/tetraprenyl-beta-curcumene cyclase
MRYVVLMALVGVPLNARAAQLDKLPANTWVELKYTTEQPSSKPEEKGQWRPVGWNKLVYDPDGKRVLFYDRWVDRKHGGLTIYGNCLFAFDPASGKVTPIKIDNWTKLTTAKGGYRTVALPENDKEPTPCPRHVYHAFEYVPPLKAVFISNGANQSAMREGKLLGHDLCTDTWRLDLKSNRWTRIDAPGSPPNRLDDAMAYCPDTHSLIYSGTGCQLWILDLNRNAWRKAKESPPTHGSMGRTIFHDPPRKRMLIAGGGRLDAWTRGKAPEFHELYAFDPKTEKVTRLADAPTTLYSSHLAYDSRRQLFLAVAVFNKREQRSGMFCYDPRKDAWHEIEPANPIPPHKSWMGWMKLCYDSHHDCFIGMSADRFYAFRYEPAKDGAGRKPAGDKPDAPKNGRLAIERSLTFLQADATRWRKERRCATCHHGTMTVWALSEAKAQGYPVEPAVLADMARWTRERLKDIDRPRDTRPGWRMVNSPALYLATMAHTVPAQTAVTAAELKQIAGHLLRHQEADGSWAWSSAPAKNRPPPFFESDEVATLLAYMALGPYVPKDAGQKSPERAARARAAAWLATNQRNDTTQAAAFRLLLKVRAGESAKTLAPALERFLRRQNKDGGWSQLKGLPSDAYATGQALYVLSMAGVKNDRAEIRRAVAFLVDSQKDDGSWPMSRRGHPGVTPGPFSVPIIYFGSAWATLGLMRSVPQ